MQTVLYHTFGRALLGSDELLSCYQIVYPILVAKVIKNIATTRGTSCCMLFRIYWALIIQDAEVANHNERHEDSSDRLKVSSILARWAFFLRFSKDVLVGG